MIVKYRIKSKLDRKAMANILFCLYLCIPFMKFLCDVVLNDFGLTEFSRPISLMIVYIPLLFAMMEWKKMRPLDFLAILLSILFSFLFTIIIHPEYEYWYTREFYGVWDYVLRPDNGLYIYLFIRLVDDPKEILKCVKLSAWPIYFYMGFRLMKALQQGYWLEEGSKGQAIHMPYNLSFGYDLLLFTLVFLYSALEERKATDYFGAAVGLLMILIGGSRGPMLNIAIFLSYIFVSNCKIQKRSS